MIYILYQELGIKCRTQLSHGMSCSLFHPPSRRSRSRSLVKRTAANVEKEKRRKKSGTKSKWRFNYNGRLITAIAHHEPSSRNSRIIRASGLRRETEGITDFPADTLDTLENPSLFPRALVLPPLFSLSHFILDSPSRAHRKNAHHLYHAYIFDGFHFLAILICRLSINYISNRYNVSPLFIHTSLDE